MAKKMFGVVCAAALALSLGACGGGRPGGAATPSGGTQGQEASSQGAVPGKDDSIKIDEIDWTVEESVMYGDRRLVLSYENNSPFTILYFGVEFAQRDDVTDEQRSVFDEAYANPDYDPGIEPEEMYIVGQGQDYVEPGETSDPISCGLSMAITLPTSDQLDLMEPSIATIRYAGGDGHIYTEYYDFLNDNYALNKNLTEDVFSEWPDNELAQMVPSLESSLIKMDDYYDDRIAITVYGLTEDDFSAYVEQIIDAGYTIDADEREAGYDAANAEGYEVGLSYYENTESIYLTVDAPGE